MLLLSFVKRFKKSFLLLDVHLEKEFYSVLAKINAAGGSKMQKCLKGNAAILLHSLNFFSFSVWNEDVFSHFYTN